MHDLMHLNEDENHMANKVEKFFEIHRVKRPVLHLIRKNIFRRELYDQEKTNLRIINVELDNRFINTDKRSLE